MVAPTPRPGLVRFGGGLVFACAVSLAAAATAAEPLAVVAALRGRVQVVPRAGAPVAASFGRALERGDKLVVGPGAAVTLFFDDGNVVELGERSTITVTGRVSAQRGAHPGLPGEVVANVSRFVIGGSRETGLVAMSTLRGGDASPLLLAPRRTEVLEPRPSFRWRAVSGATRYQVSISGDRGELWTREATGERLQYSGHRGLHRRSRHARRALPGPAPRGRRQRRHHRRAARARRDAVGTVGDRYIPRRVAKLSGMARNVVAVESLPNM
jgi:hypothetical protein